MTEVAGVTTAQIDQAGDDYAHLLEQALDRAARTVARRWSPTSTEDDLGAIRTLWLEQVDQMLAPTLALLLHTGAAGVRSQLRATLAAAGAPPPKADEAARGHRFLPGRADASSAPAALAATVAGGSAGDLPERQDGQDGGRTATPGSVRNRLPSPGHLTAAAVRMADIPPVPHHLTDAYLATAANRLQGAGDLLWGAARDQLREGVAAGESHRRLATRIRKATGLALPRAKVIARTEARDALLAGSLNQVRATGLTGTKTWVSVRRSPRTRPEHKHAHGQTVDLRGFFEVGGWPMDRPHDDTAPAEATISCRCGLKYSLDTADVLLGPTPQRAPADDRLLRQVWAGGMVRAGVTVEQLADVLADLGLTAAADEAFHLPGKHNQKSHGHGKSAGAPGPKAAPSGGKGGGGGGGTVGGTAYDDPAAAKKFLDDHYGTWKKKDLTDAEYAGLSFYQSPGFALMNGQLRGLKRGDIKADMTFGDSDLKRARKASGDLTKGIAKAPPLPHAVQVHRGFDAGQFGDLSPGMTVTDKGFTSTSLTSSGVASVGRAGKPGVMRIELPKGTKAGAGSARELILPPGSSFQVVGVRTEGGTTMVDARLVGGGG